MRSPVYGIRQYFAWLTLLPLLVMAIGMETYFLTDRYEDLDHDLLTRGESLARQLANSSEYGVFSSNRGFLEDLARGTLGEADVRSVIVLNSTAQVLVKAGDPKIETEKLLELIGWDHPVLNRGKLMFLYKPIFSAQVELDPTEPSHQPRQVGAVIIGMGWERITDLKTRLMLTTVSGAVVLLLITLYLIYLASRHIIDPIRRLSRAVEAIGTGALDIRVSERSRISELDSLTDGINSMTAKLQQEHTYLQHRIDDATEQLRSLAFYDSLTQLPNRRLLNDRLGQAIVSGKRSGRYGALMFLDLDNFKPLNDKYGHAIGDLLLIEAARRIIGCVREKDTVARFGGDEFVVMLGELDVDEDESTKMAAVVAEKIRAALGETYHLSYQDNGKAISVEHVCTSSIGVALFQDRHASAEQILIQADTAMYLAKQEGRNCIRFSDDADVLDLLHQ